MCCAVAETLLVCHPGDVPPTVRTTRCVAEVLDEYNSLTWSSEDAYTLFNNHVEVYVNIKACGTAAVYYWFYRGHDVRDL